MEIRRYMSEDVEEVVRLFRDTVHTVNAADYTAEQLDVWAPLSIDIREWDRSLGEHFSVVATENGELLGFGDIDASGYLDRLYVAAAPFGEMLVSILSGLAFGDPLFCCGNARGSARTVSGRSG